LIVTLQYYPKKLDVNNLEEWPFDNVASDYVIVSGHPRASGRIDFLSADGLSRAGIWRCTPGIFDCNELGDELQTITAGRVVLSMEGQASIECVPGDSVFTLKGQRVRWDIRETVTKIFHTSNL